MVQGGPYGIHPATGMPYSDKSKVVAGVLQILLPFGVGRFYTGHIGIGVAQLLTSFICIGGIWSFIDGIMMLMGNVPDAQGRPLRE
ncbi:MAG: TM2 domain-containing protein [Polyangiaceae bacterium]|jgi:TM2 domain-containing membrane protein YozV|nr:TM2 domain-containing protein [Polyangiaceae bacterium]